MRDNDPTTIICGRATGSAFDLANDSVTGAIVDFADETSDVRTVVREVARVLAPGCRAAFHVAPGSYALDAEVRAEALSAGFRFVGEVFIAREPDARSPLGSFPWPRRGVIRASMARVIFVEKEGAEPPVAPDRRRRSRLANDEWAISHADTWRFETRLPANVMIPAVARRIVRMISCVGETILDPLVRDATIIEAVVAADRRAIGVTAADISANHMALLVRSTDARLRSAKNAREMIAPRTGAVSPAAAVESRMTAAEATATANDGPTKTRRVLDVTPDFALVLDDGRRVRLRGIRIEDHVGARRFVLEKTARMRVYIDEPTALADGSFTAYVHLKSRLHLNAHILKAGWAIACRDDAHRMRARFIAYEESARHGRMAPDGIVAAGVPDPLFV